MKKVSSLKTSTKFEIDPFEVEMKEKIDTFDKAEKDLLDEKMEKLSQIS